MSSFIERVSDLLVVCASTEIKEVNCYFSSRDIYFFDTVVDSDGGDIFLYEPSLAVAFDDAGFSYFSVSD